MLHKRENEVTNANAVQVLLQMRDSTQLEGLEALLSLCARQAAGMSLKQLLHLLLRQQTPHAACITSADKS